MKIDLNDPRITAFALGELKGNDAIEIARAVRMDARVRNAVDEARETASLLMESLGGNKTFMLTPEQRRAVRRAGPSPATADLPSAKVPFWRHPAIAGISVAAAVALALYLVGGRPGGGAGKGGSDDLAEWDWEQVDMDSLTVPAVVDPSRMNGTPDDGSTPGAQGGIQSVSSAISDDTTSFRREVEQRVEGMKREDILSATQLPELENGSAQPWRNVVSGEPMNVPLAAGATSWPWLKRSIEELKTLPPQRAVRIEEMVNHFRYKKASMVSAAGLAADMELCHTPWNPATVLLAVHLNADSNAGAADAAAALELEPDRVKRVRLIGYARMDRAAADASGAAPAGPSRMSRSHGNYVLYELELDDAVAATDHGAIATLTLGQRGKVEGSARLPIGRVASWIHASADMRFASTVAACGMLLANSPSMGELDSERLVTLVGILETQDSTMLGGDRRGALKLMREAARLMGVDAGRE
ncbi:MAG: von Willebrand factor type A domain-containing protein [Akkermansiaceae bacterium]|nr:von Willebrand factor type A domain-containing protein [Akkermansiaceae bacterium]